MSHHFRSSSPFGSMEFRVGASWQPMPRVRHEPGTIAVMPMGRFTHLCDHPRSQRVKPELVEAFRSNPPGFIGAYADMAYLSHIGRNVDHGPHTFSDLILSYQAAFWRDLKRAGFFMVTQ